MPQDTKLTREYTFFVNYDKKVNYVDSWWIGYSIK